MSMGTKSLTFAPIVQEMLPRISEHYKNVPMHWISSIFSIMTKKLITETLAFVTVIGMISRYLAGHREDDAMYGKYGAGTKLSAVRRDGKGKVQSPIMKLLHDVIVELQMAGGNFCDLQNFLRQNDLCVVTLHSCYMLIIAKQDEKDFYRACQNDQERRTALDWSSDTELVGEKQVLDTGDYTDTEAKFAHEVFDLSLELAKQIHPEKKPSELDDACLKHRACNCIPNIDTLRLAHME